MVEETDYLFERGDFERELSENLGKLEKIRVLIIGDTIIDKYTYVTPKGRAIKDPILSCAFNYEENYAGGALAIANHAISYVGEVKLVTLIGDENPQLEFIQESLKEGISLKTFTKKDSPTTIKERFIDLPRGQKMFKIEHMNDQPISEELSEEISDFLERELPNYDVVIVSDYGHGFLNKRIRGILQEKSRFLSLNVQSNSANMGYNYVRGYGRSDFLTMNEEELRLPLEMRFEEVGEIIPRFQEVFGHGKFLVTLSKRGCMLFDRGKIYHGHSIANKVLDTVGAGDAVFTITSLFVYSGIEGCMIPFIANCAGSIGASIIGNKEFVDKGRLIKFMEGAHNGLE
jgi:rfaE bifunctional protein kinase chain/domain